MKQYVFIDTLNSVEPVKKIYFISVPENAVDIELYSKENHHHQFVDEYNEELHKNIASNTIVMEYATRL